MVAGTGEAAAQPSPPAAPAAPPAVEPIATPAPPVQVAAATAPTVPPGIRASPAARKLAATRGIDLAALSGSGPHGAIVEVDVLAAASRPRPAAAAPREAVPDMAPMRRAIAAAMAHSKREIPHYYLQHQTDVGAAQAWLEQHNAAQPPAGRLLFGALLVKAVTLALRDFPEFNGFFGEDGFTPSQSIHAGIAIAIRGGGLAAPAIHNAADLPLAELMARMRDLVTRARRGGFRSSEISDPTVTISSLGERGVDTLLPVIYPPQVAIVGFGTPALRPWVVDGAVAPRPVLSISLGADHRASDGHRGALFLRAIAELLQNPEDLT
jgi:pyruvate dehydrogenase E2 component (dihydrolipoamide acetyltransferase)